MVRHERDDSDQPPRPPRERRPRDPLGPSVLAKFRECVIRVWSAPGGEWITPELVAWGLKVDRALAALALSRLEKEGLLMPPRPVPHGEGPVVLGDRTAFSHDGRWILDSWQTAKALAKDGGGKSFSKARKPGCRTLPGSRRAALSKRELAKRLKKFKGAPAVGRHGKNGPSRCREGLARRPRQGEAGGRAQANVRAVRDGVQAPPAQQDQAHGRSLHGGRRGPRRPPRPQGLSLV